MVPAIERDAVRRAVLFAIHIGVPLCVGVALGEARAALLGGICGLLFAFADNEGPLPSRLFILYLTGAGIAAGGGIGLLFHGFPWPFWLLFIAATFAAGWLNSRGKAPSMAARHGAMALAVASGEPRFEWTEIWYVIGALGVATLARTIDHLISGPIKQQRVVRSAPSGGWTRFALAYGGAATASLWIGNTLDPERVLWVVTTTLVVMQPDARMSYVRIVERIIGTVVGVIAAYAITSALHTAIPLCAAIVAIAALVPHHLQHRYWLHTGLIALLILLAYDLAMPTPNAIHGLFIERLQDMLLGCAFALVGTVLAFPGRLIEVDN
jgi:uncharacterized membrane protein YccC